MEDLIRHQKHRDFVSVSRNEIDDNDINGFILAVSAELVVLQNVYDFHLDGLRVIKRADITRVQNSDTNVFQKSLMEQEGLLAQMPFEQSFDLRSFRALVSQLAEQYELLIVERESLPECDFFIGKVLRTTPTRIYGQFFSGTGEWSEQPEILRFKDITSCQVDANYIRFYQRHFARISSGPSQE